MKRGQKVLKVLKGIGTTLLLLVGVLAVAAIVFFDKIPIAVVIPAPEVYAVIDRDEYLVANDGIENAQAATVVYQSTATDLENYGADLRYISGTTEPFITNEPGASDIPTDTIKTQQKTNSEAGEKTKEVDQ